MIRRPVQHAKEEERKRGRADIETERSEKEGEGGGFALVILVCPRQFKDPNTRSGVITARDRGQRLPAWRTRMPRRWAEKTDTPWLANENHRRLLIQIRSDIMAVVLLTNLVQQTIKLPRLLSRSGMP